MRKILTALAALAVLVLGTLLALRWRAPEVSVPNGICSAAETQREAAARSSAPLPPAALRDFLTRQGIDARSLATISGPPGAETMLLIIPGEGAVQLWRKLRAAVPQTGRWPVLMGEDRELLLDLKDNFEVMAPEGGPAAVLAKARGIDVARWLEERRQADPDVYDVPRASWLQRAGLRGAPRPKNEIWVHRDVLSGVPYNRVGVALVPTARSWEAPAYLAWGGWNDCPEPAAQVAILERWQSLYGAEVLGMGTDTVELAVSCPIAGREEALSVAREQFIYCYDIVHQGTGTLDHLAAGLVRSGVWFFWWD